MVARFVRLRASATTLTVSTMHHLKALKIILLAVAAWVAMAASLAVFIVSPLLRIVRFMKARQDAGDRASVRASFWKRESTQH